MCGIIGYIGPKDVVPVLIDGLRQLEYRGYDSAGVAVVRDGAVDLRRSAGKLSNLEAGHRRRPAHRRLRRRPHALGDARPADRRERASAPRLHRQDRRRPQRHHRELPRSEAGAAAPGPQVRHRDRHRDRRAPRRARDEGRRARERGAPGAAADARPVRAGADLGRRSREDRRRPQRPADRRRPRRRRVLRRVRHSRDPQPHARRRVPRRRGDGGHHAHRRRRSPTSSAGRSPRRRSACCGIRSWPRRPATSTSCSRRSSSSRPPRARRSSAASRRTPGKVFLEEMKITDAQLAAVERVTILACGTSWHAALVGKFLIEQLARMPVEVDYGSEYRYRDPIVTPNTLAVVITQSGETADTLAALREAKRRRRAQHRHLQRRRQHGDARDRRHGLHARRPGDRRRLDQGLHVAARRAVSARAAARPGARRAVARGVEAARRRAAAAAAAARADAEARAGDRGDRRRASTPAPTSSTSAAASTIRSRSKAR